MSSCAAAAAGINGAKPRANRVTSPSRTPPQTVANADMLTRRNGTVVRWNVCSMPVLTKNAPKF